MKTKLGSRFSFPPTVLIALISLLAATAFAPAGSLPNRNLGKASAVAILPFVQAPPEVMDFRPNALVRIAFAQGTTSGTASGSLASGATASYVLWAYAGQPMIAAVDSGIYLEIYGRSSGISLVRLSNSASSWQGSLPRSEDYIVNVKNNGGSSANYSLTVTIPARIRFARGAYSGSVWGRGSAAKVISYVLWARANQTMTATLTSSSGTVYLAIRGFGGGQSLVASSDSRTTWTGVLPQSQDYLVEAVQGGSYVNFTLTVTIV
jgi:hypothetical protein